MSRLKPFRHTPYGTFIAWTPKCFTVDRLYIIIVHGTTFGFHPGSWFKRQSQNGDYPFCQHLSDQLKEVGVNFSPWLNCHELGMDEFEWTGANDHNARFIAGRALAEYINACYEQCMAREEGSPGFILIGHSHGGNVILASLGLLKETVPILGIHLLGTPFISVRNEYFGAASWTNLYLSSGQATMCPFRVYYAMDKSETDEVTALFSGYKIHIGPLLRQIINRYAQKPTFFAIKPHPLYDIRQWITYDTGYGLLEATGVYPTRWESVKMRLRFIVSFVFWPFRILVMRLLRGPTENFITRQLFGLLSGLPTHLFHPQDTRITQNYNFAVFNGMTINIPIEEADRVGVEFPTMSGSNDTPESIAVAGLLSRLGAGVKLMHTAYYRSELVIRELAQQISYDLGKYYPHLCSVEDSKGMHGKIQTKIKNLEG